MQRHFFYSCLIAAMTMRIGWAAPNPVDLATPLSTIPVDDWMKNPNDLVISQNYLNVVIRGDGKVAFQLFFPAFGGREEDRDIPRFGTVSPEVIRALLTAMNDDHFLSLPRNSMTGGADAAVRTYHLTKNGMTYAVSVQSDDKPVSHTFLALLHALSDLPALTTTEISDYCEVLSLDRDPSFLHVSASSQCVHDLQNHFPPSTGQAWFWPAAFFENQKQYHEAHRLYHQYLLTFPHGKAVPEALLEDAICLVALNDRASATMQFKKVFMHYPNSKYASTAKLEFAENLFILGQYQSALDAYRSSLKAADSFSKNSIDSRIALCEVKLSSGNAQREQQFTWTVSTAAARPKTPTKTNPPDAETAEALFQSGYKFEEDGNWYEAERQFQAIARRFNIPEQQDARFQIIDCDLQKGEFTEAYKQFTTFQKSYPTDRRLKPMCDTLLELLRRRNFVDDQDEARQLECPR